MKILFSPSVYLASRQELVLSNGKHLPAFAADHGIDLDKLFDLDAMDPDALPEVAGRLCYMSFTNPRPGGNAKYVEHIKECGHGSVLEHTVFGLILTGVSRSLTHELVRHRAGTAYSQLSQRYVDESVCEVVVPLELKEEVAQAMGYLSGEHGGYPDDLSKVDMETISRCLDKCQDQKIIAGLVWLRSMRQTSEDYNFLSNYLYDKGKERHFDAQNANPKPNQQYTQFTPEDNRRIRKAARGAARSVLPNATETKIFVTANVRAWRHFLEMRGNRGADAEIRVLANKVLQVMRVEAPNLFADYKNDFPLPDGTFEITTPYEKV